VLRGQGRAGALPALGATPLCLERRRQRRVRVRVSGASFAGDVVYVCGDPTKTHRTVLIYFMITTDLFHETYQVRFEEVATVAPGGLGSLVSPFLFHDKN
jgi:hypothetical protein